MKSIPLILVFVIIVAAWMFATANTKTEQPVTAAALMASADIAPAPTASATPNYTPTPDFLILAEGTRAALVITQEKQKVDLDNAVATSKIAAITSTVMVGESRATDQHIRDMQSTADAHAQETKTQAAVSTQTQIANVQATENAIHKATEEAPKIRRAEIIAEWQPGIEMSKMLGIYGLCALVGYLFIRIAKVIYGYFIDRREYYRALMEIGTAPVEQARPDPVVIQETERNNGYPSGMQIDLPAFITREQLQAVVVAILDDKVSFSRAALVDTHILTDGVWDQFREWMYRLGYSRPVRENQDNSPWYITAKGYAFLKAIKTSPA
jgi:hypothetical protein